MWWHQPVACVHVSSCDILVILVIMVSSHLLRSISQWTLTVKVETKCLANLNTCVLRGLVYCCEVWKQSIKNCGSYKVFTDFHIWLTRSLSLSLSLHCSSTSCPEHLPVWCLQPSYPLRFGPSSAFFSHRYGQWVWPDIHVGRSVSTNTQNLNKISWKCGCYTSNRQIKRKPNWSSCTLPPFRETIVVIFNLKTCF